MKLPQRFALSTLLLLMVVVAMVFGWAQWRRQKMLREEKQLESQGARILIGDDWFWPILSSSGSIVANKNSDGTFQVGAERLTEDDAKRRFREVASRMHELGIRSIDIYIDARPRADGMMMSETVEEEWLD